MGSIKSHSPEPQRKTIIPVSIALMNINSVLQARMRVAVSLEPNQATARLILE
jgi:hypothetical protein